MMRRVMLLLMLMVATTVAAQAIDPLPFKDHAQEVQIGRASCRERVCNGV